MIISKNVEKAIETIQLNLEKYSWQTTNKKNILMLIRVIYKNL